MNDYWIDKNPEALGRLLARRIVRICRRREISLTALSEKAGISLGSLKDFEQTGEISLLSLTKVAIALGIEEELASLFENVPFLSIEEVIREQEEDSCGASRSIVTPSS